jgi:hypothetical protein
MAQIKLLKIASDGVPLEFDSTADEITMLSFSVNGGGPSLSATGLAMATQDITGIKNLSFNDPTVDYFNQTAGNLIIDNVMAKERSNVMTTAGDILFPVVADAAGELDAFRLPAIAGVPSATPTASGEGFAVWDSTNNKFMVWGGSSWVDVSSSGSAADISNTYTAGEALTARDFVYISAANTVSKADASVLAKSYAVGFATSSVSSAASVGVKTDGIIGGFTGMTAGARQYLSGATAGAITATVPSGTGHTIVQAGYAKSATDLQIQMLQLGRRA